MTVDLENVRTMNHAAYRRLKPEIDARYPANRYIAILNGNIAADAGTFDGLYDAVPDLLRKPEDVMVVQAGVDYPKKAIIFM